MAYTIVENYGTEFAVDWDIVARLCRSYQTTYYQLELSETTEMSESKWYNPFSWWLPKTRTIDVDWPKVRERAKRACDMDMVTYRKMGRTDMRSVALDLEWRLELTAENRRRFVNQLRDVQADNMAAINESVDDYDGLIDAARFVRDTSADIVAVGSTIATGGAAAGLLGASSALKGIYKYQDTGSAGAALLHGGGSLVLGVFKVGGKKVTAGAEYALIVVKGVLETGTSLVAGDSLGTAVEKGGLKIASAGAAQVLFSPALVKQLFERMPLPFTVFSVVSRSGPNWMAVDVADKVVAGATKKVAERGMKYGAAGMLGDSDSGRAAPTPVSGFADEVPIEKKLLLNFGIVNMNKGIGRGW